MLLHNTQAITKPPAVVIEKRADGNRIILSGNIKQLAEDDTTIFQFDEVIFMMPSDRHETLESISEHFNSWWEFGQNDDDEVITLEQRVSDLEEIIMELMEG